MRRVLEKNAASLLILTLVAGACYWLKAYYSAATPGELRFILLPTGALVQSLSGHVFQFEPGVGVSSNSAQVAITRACAGVNFLIVLFAVLAITGTLRLKEAWRKAAWVLGSAVAAYAVTLAVNTVRIFLALHWHREHLLMGTLVYLVGLCVAFTVAQSLLDGPVGASSAARWLPLPLALYLGMTLVVPVVRGAAGTGVYWGHALVVLSSTFVVGGFFWLVLAGSARGMISSNSWFLSRGTTRVR
ncbi:MAG: exosortase K [Polyangiaceae bacterium]|nr:exosortase K [Polyangiaceae bacterium]